MNFREATNTLLATVKLEELCERLGIETKRAGASVKALCQFHNDTKPSMELYDSNPEKSAFHCFSCGAHGDIFALVKEVKGMDFKESHEWLCSEYNIKVDRTKAAKRVQQRSEPLTDVIQNVYQYALDFYSRHQDKEQLKAVLLRRGYSDEFGASAGLCLVGDRTLSNHLDSLEYPEDTHKLFVFDKYESAGLIKKNRLTENSNETKNLNLENLYFDHFRKGRLLFPIRDIDGVIQGFAGRLTNNSNAPKYLFSKGMDKSSLLYRSEIAFSNIYKSGEKYNRLFLCEGLFDALRLESLGYNSVAVLGASITDKQCENLLDISNRLSKNNRRLEINLFFDNDAAGLRATDISIKKIISRLGLKNIDLKVYYSKNKDKVDPDSFLKDKGNSVSELLASIEYPFPAINLSQDLNITPTEVEDNEFLKDLPYSLKIRTIKKWHGLFARNQSGLVLDEFENNFGEFYWFKILRSYDPDSNRTKVNNEDTFISDDKQRLHLAFSVSKSSMSDSGMFANNDAEWRRMEMCLPLLEDIISDRFSKYNNDLRPTEPLNTIYVSREISGEEYREMSMHCVEDLISHQYVLSELLTERCDHIDNFSLNIPATRYYRKSNTTITTGEGGKSEHDQTLSFAYQIDMEVLEGREVPKTDGMFRPYFQCWKEFTRSINKAANNMNQVNMVRLDLKRYYDRIKRYVVQDALRNCIPEDLSIYSEENLFSLIQDNGDGQKSKIVDWLLEQSFGYKKYDPKTGDIRESDIYMGIPQGPDISSFLANLVLFKVDNAARNFLEKNNDINNDRYTAWYARYVDDMVLIAEDVSTLSKLRIIVEEAVRKLELELIAKEQPTAMTADEFEVYLTQGKALASSGPTGNVELVLAEDIDFMGRIERYQALSLLNSKDLYSDDVATVKAKINMAMHCTQLRFSDIKKVAKWVWFVATKETTGDSSKELVSNYQQNWIEVTSKMQKPLSPNECPWEDPLLLSFDGLNHLISRNNNWVNDSLSQQDIIEKEKVRDKLISLIEVDLVKCLVNDNPKNVTGWAVSKKELTRTYWQKSTSLLWHAKQYSGVVNEEYEQDSILTSLQDNHTLTVSLGRTYLTELHYKSSFRYRALETSHRNEFGKLSILLQVVYLLLSKSNSIEDDEPDALSYILEEIKSVVNALSANYVSKSVFSLFIPDNSDSPIEVDNKLSIKVLYFICSLTSNSKLIKMLSSRWNGLINGKFDEADHSVISPLPTIDEHTLYGYHVDASNLISALIKVSTNDIVENDDIYVSNNEGINYTNWNDVKNEAEGLQYLRTEGSALRDANKIFIDPPNPIREINVNVLKWASSTYRSLIKCSTEGNKIPTWCNTSLVSFPEQYEGSEENNVCIISSRNRETSFPQAFIRNGGKSLRPIQVPNHNVRFWQAGVALTDMLGFTRDLDAYADVEEVSSESSELPQARLLKNSLRKLNGSVYFSKPEPSRGNERVPRSIQRTLILLDNFPNTGKSSDSYLFGFLSEMETQIMRIRLSSNSNPTDNGKLLQLYGQAVKACLARVPLEWFSHLPRKVLEESSGFRMSERFWLTLHNVFEQAINDSSIDSNVGDLDVIQNAILLGCQVNLVEASLKAAVFELQANNTVDPREFYDIELNEDLFRSDFLLNKYCLYDGGEDASIESLGVYFTGLLKDKAQQSTFSAITPLGWLLIALVKKGLVKRSGQNLGKQHNEVFEEVAQSHLIDFLTLESTLRTNGYWPLEHEFSVGDVNSLLHDLNQIHSVDSVVLKDVKDEHFSYDSVKGEFKNLWKLKKWQIDVSASSLKDSKPYYESVGNRLASCWTESYKGDNLVHVSSLGHLYGGILKEISDSSFIGDATQVADQQGQSITRAPSTLSEEAEKTATPREKIKPSYSPELISGSQNSVEIETYDLVNLLDRVAKVQNRSWSIRKDNRAPSHTRVAMFQMNLKGTYGDGYYTHYSKNEELLDDCALGARCKEIRDELCNKSLTKARRESLILELEGCQSDERCAQLHEQLTSYNAAESRRRSILKGAIESCIQLNVDLLVLPEYSVQPATILWLKKFLKGREISILAGTYRLPEGCSTAMLKELTSADYSALVSEFQSVMTLLVPYQDDKVLCFNRAKKYASPAANELIKPYQHKIEPLFSLKAFERHLLSDSSGAALRLEDIEALMKTPHISLLGFMQELICAELFLLTNPVNYLNLASEYINLSNKFGLQKTRNKEDAVKDVLDDIKSISFNLSGGASDQNSGFQSYNRSIVTIPAMTTRKQDYWIFGQGAMLANGISTVFCNSVSEKDSTGGSCFIGLDSWIGEEKKPFITPYNGWSKGIYYGNKSDTLQKEQSLVVVDIDPKMMSLGSPRPQALPVPMKLVAHIPVIELSSGKVDIIHGLEVVLSEFESFYKKYNTNEIIDPELATSLIKKLLDWFRNSCSKDERESLEARISNWKRNWRINPQVDMAALTDWIVVPTTNGDSDV